MTYKDYEQARAAVASIHGIPVERVSHDAAFDYLLGHAEPGARETAWSGRFRGVATPTAEEWPAPLPTLLVDGSGGE